MEKFYNGSADVDECTFLAGIITDEEGGPFDEYCRMRWNRPGDDVPADVRKRMKSDIMRQIEEKERVRRRRKWNMWGKRIFHTSVAVAFLAVVFLTCWRLAGGNEPEVFKVVAERGQKSSLTLPDGSRVWLHLIIIQKSGGSVFRERLISKWRPIPTLHLWFILMT